MVILWWIRRKSPLAIESSTGAFSQISASRCAAHEIWSHVFDSLLIFMKKTYIAKAMYVFLVDTKGVSTCYRKLHWSFLPNFRQPLRGTRNLEPRIRLPSKFYEKNIHSEGYVCFFGGHEGSLHLLSKAPPELSPKFPPTAARHAKFGATYSTPF